MSELAYLTATELVKRIKAREISSAETLDYFVERMKQHNPKLNASQLLRSACQARQRQ